MKESNPLGSMGLVYLWYINANMKTIKSAIHVGSIHQSHGSYEQ